MPKERVCQFWKKTDGTPLSCDVDCAAQDLLDTFRELNASMPAEDSLSLSAITKIAKRRCPVTNRRTVNRLPNSLVDS